MKLYQKIRIVTVCLGIPFFLGAMELQDLKLEHQEKEKEQTDELLNITSLDFTPQFVFTELKDEDDDQSDWVIVEKEPIPQLDLSLLDNKQSDQKQVLFEKGKLFFYDSALIKEAFKKFSNVKDHGFRTLFRYVPKNVDKNKKPRACIIVHGTWGNKTKGYYDPSTTLMRNYLKYIAAKADEEQVPIDIYSYEWAATNDDDARVYAGMLLGYMMNVIKKWYGEKIDIFAFSHGVNTALVGCNQLEDFSITEFIAVAPPVLEHGAWFYSPHNIKEFFSFFSKHDIIRWFGHQWSTSYNNSCTRYKNFCNKGLHSDAYDQEGRIYKNSCNGSVMNIDYTEDNEPKGHTETPDYLMKYIIETMQTIRTDFMYKNIIRNLSVNIVTKKDDNDQQLFDHCNVSLFPQDDKEEKIYDSELPEKMLTLSKQNLKDHFKRYGYEKNQEGSISYWYNLLRKSLN